MISKMTRLVSASMTIAAVDAAEVTLAEEEILTSLCHGGFRVSHSQ